MAKIPGAEHLRATLTTSAETLGQDSRPAEIMVRMLSLSLEWMAKAGAGEIASRLDLQNKDEKKELIDILARNRSMFASDARFSRRQVEATAKFMRAADILTDDGFDLNTLIASQIAGVKP
jgi:hypothetical protein